MILAGFEILTANILIIEPEKFKFVGMGGHKSRILGVVKNDVICPFHFSDFIYFHDIITREPTRHRVKSCMSLISLWFSSYAFERIDVSHYSSSRDSTLEHRGTLLVTKPTLWHLFFTPRLA